MNILTILTIVLVLIAIGMVALILLQRGAGATTGAAFGSGASGTVFGARGSASFLTRITGVMAAMFFAIALAMAVMVSRGMGINDGSQDSVMDALSTQQPAADTDLPVDGLPEQSMISADDLPTDTVGQAADGGAEVAGSLPSTDPSESNAETADAAAQADQGDDDNN